MIDAYWIYTKPSSHRPIKVSAVSRNVFSKTTSTREIDETSGSSYCRSIKSSWRCSGDGVEPFLHGNERCPETRRFNDHKLYARCNEIKCEDEGGVFKSPE